MRRALYALAIMMLMFLCLVMVSIYLLSQGTLPECNNELSEACFVQFMLEQ